MNHPHALTKISTTKSLLPLQSPSSFRSWCTCCPCVQGNPNGVHWTHLFSPPRAVATPAVRNHRLLVCTGPCKYAVITVTIKTNRNFSFDSRTPSTLHLIFSESASVCSILKSTSLVLSWTQSNQTLNSLFHRNCSIISLHLTSPTGYVSQLISLV